jgi:hypothetical protein
MQQRDFSDFDIRVLRTADLGAADRARLLALFRESYRDANAAYLEKSLGLLRFVSIAMHGDTPAGFSLGDGRIMDLPRLPQQAVNLAGICCIGAEFRRRGLFGKLESLAIAQSHDTPPARYLNCGRMAHPVSFRIMAANPTAIPRPGFKPTPWQQEIGAAIAQAYGVADFDPKTFVCHGSGVPIGYPNIDLDVAPEEWEVFEHVNRDKGNSLLGLNWMPDAPEGWLTSE